jgi:hypothetical protein
MIPSLDTNYWSDRYRSGETAWDAGSVTTPLKEYFDTLKDRSIAVLIPGAGNAHEAEYLVKNGFTDVTVCDLAAEPLRNLKQRCPEIQDDHLIQKNFFDLSPRPYQLIVEQTFFCALDPSLRRTYFLKMAELLSPGGLLAGVLFDDQLNNDRPPFGGTREEYLDYIPRNLRILKFERCRNSIPPRKDREIFMMLKKLN